MRRDELGKVVERISGGRREMDYYLAFEDGAWTISNIEDPK